MEEQNTNGNGYFKGEINARVSNLEKDVTEIKTNHLPHIQAGLDRVEERLDGLSVRLAMWALGIIASIFIALVTINLK